jgi:hypothetical protein
MSGSSFLTINRTSRSDVHYAWFSFGKVQFNLGGRICWLTSLWSLPPLEANCRMLPQTRSPTFPFTSFIILLYQSSYHLKLYKELLTASLNNIFQITRVVKACYNILSSIHTWLFSIGGHVNMKWRTNCGNFHYVNLWSDHCFLFLVSEHIILNPSQFLLFPSERKERQRQRRPSLRLTHQKPTLKAAKFPQYLRCLWMYSV